MIVLVVVVVWATGSPTPARHSTTPPAVTTPHGAGGIPAAEAGLLPWRLSAPLSRAVVLPGTGSQLVILGGLTANNVSATGIYALDTTTGALTEIGTLAAGLHDAAGAELNGRYFLFGGGSPTTVATVQAFTPAAGSRPAATVVGQLPQPRSDAAAVTVGTSVYVVGGYDGSNPDPEVLSTTDGATYRNVAALPVPVRYPAVAVAGGKIYVFGGQAVTGAGADVNTIQVVDPVARTAKVVGHLPIPLAGAAAATIGSNLYLAGGDSSVPQTVVPGVGTTQLTTPPHPKPGAGASGTTLSGFDRQATTGGAPSAASARLVADRAAGTTTTTTTGPTTSTAPTGSGAPSPVTSSSVPTVWSYDPATNKLLAAGTLQVPISHAAVTVLGSTAWLVGGEQGASSLESVVQMISPNAGFGTAGRPGAGSPYSGAKLLVADRGNNRLLLFDDTMKVVWTYPSATSPADPLGFYFPDDAFFVDHGRAILSNQEENETIVEIAYPSGKIIWSYGHPKQTGTAPGFLSEPDDAYLLKSGQISVADANNCRIVVINHDGTVAHQIGTNGVCKHNPPTSMGTPNGDTPLADGNLLVSEITGSWVSEYTLAGQLVWTTHLPISYPSDPQQLGADNYLIADYAKPGAVLQFDRAGQISSRYQPSSGPGMLNHPSLAEMLPSGVILINDDYNNRMVAIDPTTGALVWQYGITADAGTAPGMLDTPDGFDLLLPDGSTPTHPQTG